jgi:hypothetical protein
VFLRFAWEGKEAGQIVEQPPRQYCATLRGINIDMGDNPNVSALRMLGAQYCVIEDVEIYGAAFAYGIDGLPGSGGSVSNVKVTGGRIGIYHDEYRPTPLLTGVELVGQSEHGIMSTLIRGPIVVAGFRIVGPAAPVAGYSAVSCAFLDRANPGTGNLVMADGSIEVTGPGGLGIDNYAQDVYLQNVYFKTATNIISGAGFPPVQVIAGDPNSWMPLDRYAFRVGSQNGYLVANHTDYGTSTNATVQVVGTSTSPPTNLVSQHLWSTSFPSWEDPHLLRITDPTFGATPDNPLIDNAPAIQAALNDAATIGGAHFGWTVFIPRGHFYVGRPIQVPAGSKLLGASETISVLQARTDWTPTNSTSILTTTSDPTNGVTMAFFAVVGNEATTAYDGFPDTTSQAHLSYVTVQSANSIWRDLQLDGAKGSQLDKVAIEPTVVFQGHGGGRIYNLCLDNNNSVFAAGQPDPGFHMISVRCNLSPLTFYAPDPEHLDQGSASFELDQAQNATLFAFKYEGAHQLLLASNVASLRVLGGSGNYGQATNSIIVLTNCAEVQLADVCRQPGGNESAGLHWLSGLGSTLSDTRPITLFSYNATGFTSFGRNGNDLVLDWSGGLLQSADSVTGPWNTLSEASSPTIVPMNATRKFFRVH